MACWFLAIREYIANRITKIRLSQSSKRFTGMVTAEEELKGSALSVHDKCGDTDEVL